MRTTLTALAALAVLAVFALGGAPAAAAPCQTAAALNGGNVNYRLCTLPDLDQRREPNEPFVAGLPGNGSMYCAPTSAVNLIAYIAAHGYPLLGPGPGPWGPEADLNQPKYKQATATILQMGGQMGTDAVTGTAGGMKPGVDAWFANNGLSGSFVVDNYYAHGGYTPRFADAAMLALQGRLVNVVVGWYDESPIWLGFARDGGHVMTMAEARIAVGPNATSREIGLRDPGNDSADKTHQSTFMTDEYGVAEVAGTFDNYARVHDKIVGLGTNGFIDGLLTIAPLDALTADQKSIKVIRPWLLAGEDAVLQSPVSSYTAAGNVIDVAFQPGGVRHPYAVENGDAIWQLDVLTGESTRFARVAGARRIVTGDPELNVFALLPRELVALDRGGKVVSRAALSEPLADIAYDGRTDRLAGVTAAGDALVLFDRGLRPAGRVALPARPCDGKLSLAYDPQTGAFWLLCDRSPVLRRIDPDRGTVADVVLEGAVGPIGLSVDDLGRLLVTDGTALAHYDGRGRRLRERGFGGMPAGSVVDVRRSFDNFDPAAMTGRAYRNVLPEDS
jgi:hypothetical protein